MLVIKNDRKSYSYTSRLFGLFLVIAFISISIAFLVTRSPESASAVDTVPTRMNFQGRLADSTGNIKPNGTYNMRLRLYTAASGGTAVWTEDRLVSAGTGITLTNGLFALQLGSVTSLPASLFASGPLYLEVELPTPATATTSSPSWLEGAMTPRNQMATSAYAYNSETLDGQDGSYYQDASNLAAGTLNSARITGAYANLTGTGALVSGSIASGFGTIATTNTIQGTRLISTVATGTAPLTVSSTTMVTNLNADLLDGQHGSYFQNASNLNAGTIADARLTSRIGQYAATVTDWDLATTNGWYMGYNIPNAPTASAWYIGDVVAHNYLWATQTVYAFTSDSSSNTQVWRRDSSDSGGTRVWGAWYRIQISQAEQDARYASISGSNNYIQNTTSPQTANINITGSITASGFTGSGSGLTNLSASNLTSGTINTARVSGAYTGITGLGTLTSLAVSGTATVGGLSVDGPNSLYLSDAGITGYGISIASSDGLLLNAANGIDANTELRVNANFKTKTSAGGASILDIDATNSAVTLGQASTTDTFTKLADPAVLPAGQGNDTSFSPDGTYMAVGHNLYPYITIYKRSGDTFTKLANPATLPNNAINGVDFSPDGQYMSVVQGAHPYVLIYKRSGDTFTKLADPATLPASWGHEVDFSSDGIYMAVAHNSTPYITIYKRSGDTFTKLANPATLPGSGGSGAQSVRFSSDGQYLSIGSAASPYIFIYKRSGDTFTKLADPSVLPTTTVTSSAFSPDGSYLALSQITGSPKIIIYQRSGNTFTKISDPVNMPISSGTGVTFSSDGKYFIARSSTSPYVSIFTYGSGGFTKVSDPATLPTINGGGMGFSADGQYVSVTTYSSPYVMIYRVGSGNSTSLTINGALTSTGVLQGSSLNVSGLAVLQGGASVIGSLDLQGRGNFVQTSGDAPGLRIQGKSSPELFDAQIFEVTDASGDLIIGVSQGGGNRVLIRGGSSFWNTAALEVYTSAASSQGLMVQGSASQTGDLLRIENSSGTSLVSVTGGGELRAAGNAGTGGQIRVSSANYSTIIRNDDNDTWFMSTAYGDPNGTWSKLPLRLQHSTGHVFMQHSPVSAGGVFMCMNSGTGLVVQGSACTYASSIRYKENVVALDSSALDILGQLRPVSFDWKADNAYRTANGGKNDFGLIAEEVAKVMPHLVAYDKDGNTTGVNYQGFTPFLIQAIKEQQSQIATLQGGKFTSLFVSGPATVESLTVIGDAHVKGDIYVDGHLVSGGNAPTVDMALLTCLDSVEVIGTDIAGEIRFNVSQTSCSSADLRLVFAKAYTKAPHATLTAKDRTSARLDSSLDASQEKMTFAFDGLQIGKAYRFTYHVIQ